MVADDIKKTLGIPDDADLGAVIDENIRDRWARALMTDAPGVQGLVRMTEDLVQRCSAAEDEVVELRGEVERLEQAALHDHGGWLMGMLCAAKCARNLGFEELADSLIRTGAVEVARASEYIETPDGADELARRKAPAEDSDAREAAAYRKGWLAASKAALQMADDPYRPLCDRNRDGVAFAANTLRKEAPGESD
jgi:hypothetical protein